jgi:hypothetical protein
MRPTSPPVMLSLYQEGTLVSPEDAARMVEACGRQLAEHYAPFWGLAPGLELVPRGKVGSPGGAPFHLQDRSTDQGVEGYHTSGPNGTEGFVFCQPSLSAGSTALTGTDAVSGVLGHEGLETACNPAANRWGDMPNGSDVALEVGDPVQPTDESQIYTIDGVVVPNFVLPAWFDPNAPTGARLDYLGLLTQPMTMTRAGYMIVRTEPGKISDVFAHRFLDSIDYDAGDVHVVEAAPGVHAVFGPEFPDRRKPGVVWKVSRRRPRGGAGHATEPASGPPA